MTYPLIDTLYSAIFRMSLEDLTVFEIRRHGCTADLLTRSELLRRIYCPHEELPKYARRKIELARARITISEARSTPDLGDNIRQEELKESLLI